MMEFLFGLTVVLSIAIVSVNCDTFAECNGVPSQTFVASPTGCQSYIYCDGEDSFENVCPNNLMFNADDSSCDDAENVVCNDATVTTVTVTTTQTTTTTTINPSLPPATISSTTVNPNLTTLIPTSSPSGQIVCPSPSRPDEVIYLPSPDSCSEYYMCYRGTAIPMTCPHNLEFNSLTASCDWAQGSNCQIIGTTTISPRDQCTGQSSGYFSYPSNCHYYYRCMNGMLTIQECPIGFGWDINRKMCTSTGCST